MRRSCFAVLLVVVCITAPSAASYVLVDVDGEGDYLTIQEGLDAAAVHDTVLVAPGTYAGPLNTGLDFGGKQIGLVSQDGAASTIIDCGGDGYCFYFHTGEDQKVVVRGFTVLGGSAERGAAVYCTSASPTIRRCVFTGHTGGNGGAIWMANSSPLIVDCTFSGNVATNYGGAIYCSESSPTIRDCVFYSNEAASYGGAVYCRNISRPVISGCVFHHNTAGSGGGAVRFYYFSSATISDCTFAHNAAPLGGGIRCGSASSPTIERSVIAFSTDGEAVYCDDDTCFPDVSHCCVFANAGGDSLCGEYADNIFEDPVFCNVVESEYGLSSVSPCMPENNPWSELIGALEQDCHLSPVEGFVYAVAAEGGHVLVRWTVSSVAGIQGFNIYRATSEDGPFEAVNVHPIEPVSPGEFEDLTVWPGASFWYELRAILVGGLEDPVGGFPVSITTGGRLSAALHAASPNPCRGATALIYDVPVHTGAVLLAVYNLRGEVVQDLVRGAVAQGRHSATWDGRDKSGDRVSSGVYFARLQVDGDVSTEKILVVR